MAASAEILYYTVEEWPPDPDRWGRHPQFASLEDFLNTQAREGKTLAFVIQQPNHHTDVTLIFSSPISYPA